MPKGSRARAYKRKRAIMTRPVRAMAPQYRRLYQWKNTPEIKTIRTYLSAAVPVVNALSVGQTYIANLILLSSYTEFTVLFEEFRIDKIRCLFRFSKQPSPEDSTTQFAPPIIRYAVDQSDTSLPATLGVLLEMPQYRSETLLPYKPVVITFKPMAILPVWRTGGTWGYQANRKSMWLSCDQPDVPHYGLKWFIDGSGGGGTGTLAMGHYQLEVRYYMSFRGCR